MAALNLHDNIFDFLKSNFITKFKLFEQIKNVMFEILQAEFKNKLTV
jgi:hypothetical protein